MASSASSGSSASSNSSSVSSTMVLRLLRRWLGRYVHGGPPDELRLQLLKGDVVLKDLKLKAEALNSLKLPVTVKAGFVGTITLKEVDQHKLYEEELQQIEEAEAATLKAKLKSKLAPAGNSWLGSLTATIIRNLNISISNVHVRYEDSVSNPRHPFSCGVTLAKLAAVTMDEMGNETFDTSGALERLVKSLQFEQLAMYHDSDCHLAQNHNYMVSPFNGVLKHPFEIVLTDLSFTVTEAQYKDWIQLFDLKGEKLENRRNIASIPWDLGITITSFLGVSSVLHLAGCSRFWRDICRSDSVWERLYKHRWKAVERETMGWRAMYSRDHCMLKKMFFDFIAGWSAEDCIPGSRCIALAENILLTFSMRDVDEFFLKPKATTLVNFVGVYLSFALGISTDFIGLTLRQSGISERMVKMDWWAYDEGEETTLPGFHTQNFTLAEVAASKVVRKLLLQEDASSVASFSTLLVSIV